MSLIEMHPNSKIKPKEMYINAYSSFGKVEQLGSVYFRRSDAIKNIFPSVRYRYTYHISFKRRGNFTFDAILNVIRL